MGNPSEGAEMAGEQTTTNDSLELQVDDRVSIPGFAGHLREWHIDAIADGEVLCHMVSQPRAQEAWSIDYLLAIGVAPRRPTWGPLVAA
jgi:hypothetical protein